MYEYLPVPRGSQAPDVTLRDRIEISSETGMMVRAALAQATDGRDETSEGAHLERLMRDLDMMDEGDDGLARIQRESKKRGVFGGHR